MVVAPGGALHTADAALERPFTVIKKVSGMNYEIQIGLKKVFQTHLLKNYVERGNGQTPTDLS